MLNTYRYWFDSAFWRYCNHCQGLIYVVSINVFGANSPSCWLVIILFWQEGEVILYAQRILTSPAWPLHEERLEKKSGDTAIKCGIKPLVSKSTLIAAVGPSGRRQGSKLVHNFLSNSVILLFNLLEVIFGSHKTYGLIQYPLPVILGCSTFWNSRQRFLPPGAPDIILAPNYRTDSELAIILRGTMTARQMALSLCKSRTNWTMSRRAACSWAKAPAGLAPLRKPSLHLSVPDCVLWALHFTAQSRAVRYKNKRQPRRLIALRTMAIFLREAWVRTNNKCLATATRLFPFLMLKDLRTKPLVWDMSELISIFQYQSSWTNTKERFLLSLDGVHRWCRDMRVYE